MKNIILFINKKMMNNPAWIFISGYLFFLLGKLTSFSSSFSKVFFVIAGLLWISVILYIFLSKKVKEYLDTKLLNTLKLIFLFGIFSLVFYLLQSDLLINKWIYSPEWEGHKSTLEKLKTFCLVTYLILFTVTVLFAVLFQMSLSTIRQDSQKISALKTMVINIGLLFSLLVVINYMANLRPFTLDMTTVGIYSISDQSKKLLSVVNKPVEVTAFFKYFTNLRKTVRLLLSDIQASNPNIKIKFADALREKDLADRKKVSENRLVVFESIDKEETDIDKRTKRRVVSINKEKDLKKAEREFISAILAVTQKKKKIYFITGHREFASSGIEISKTELISFYQEELRKLNYDVKELKIEEGGAIPKDADAIAIIGPQNSFSVSEQKLLEDYLFKGGRILLALDPNYRPDFSFLLKKFRLEYFPKKVYSEIALKQNKSDIFTNNFTKNPITEDLLDVYGSKFIIHLPGTGYFVLNQSMTPYEKDFAVDFFVKSNYRSWIEKRYNGIRDLKVEKYATKNLALLIKQKDILRKHLKNKKKTLKKYQKENLRMVVFGDANIFSNAYLGVLFNAPVAVNSIKWLLEDEKIMGILPKKVSSAKISLTIMQENIVFYFLVFIWPLMVLLLGVLGVRKYFHRKQSDPKN